jgi:hypothetical protein
MPGEHFMTAGASGALLMARIRNGLAAFIATRGRQSLRDAASKPAAGQVAPSQRQLPDRTDTEPRNRGYPGDNPDGEDGK